MALVITATFKLIIQMDGHSICRCGVETNATPVSQLIRLRTRRRERTTTTSKCPRDRRLIGQHIKSHTGTQCHRIPLVITKTVRRHTIKSNNE